MKLFLLAIIFLSSTMLFAVEEAPEADMGSNETPEHTLTDGITRGFANLFTGLIELPRNMVYYSVEYPIIGLASGTIQGAGMSALRVLGGAVDILTLGFLEDDQTVYYLGSMPTFAWEADWLPEKRNPEDYEPSGLPLIY